MDFFSVALVVFAAVVLGGVLVVGLAALVRVRSGRREDLQMKQHMQGLRRIQLPLRFCEGSTKAIP
jgi:hypothetical protein